MDAKLPFSGTVKEYTLESFTIDDNQKEIPDYKYVWKYNSHNNLSEVSHYDSNNQLVEVSRYTYDDHQNLLEITVNDAEGEEKQSIVYLYKEGKLDQVVNTANNSRKITNYDDFGNPVEEQNYQSPDSPPSITNYINQYDQGNRLVEKRAILPLANSDWISTYKYNSRGLLIEETRTRNKAVSIVLHTYNDKGDLILSEHNPGEFHSETVKKEIIYDNHNDIVEIKDYRKGWCYNNLDDRFVLTAVSRYSYIR